MTQSDLPRSLTGAELRALRSELGLDQTTFARVLGLGTRSYQRLEEGYDRPLRRRDFLMIRGYLSVMGEENGE